MHNLWASVVVWTVLVTSTSAQDTSSLPSCGVFCVNNATAISISVGRCNQDHANCYCKRGGFQQSVIDCAAKSCPGPDVPGVTQFAKDFCANSTTTDDASVSVKTVISTPSSTPTPAPASNSSEPSAIPTTNPDLTPNLTTGAKVGIAVGVPVAFLAMCGLTYFLWHQRRRDERRQAAEREGLHDSGTGGLPDMQHNEVAGMPVYEMPAKDEDPPSYVMPTHDQSHTRSSPLPELAGDAGRPGEYMEKIKHGGRPQELE